MDTRNYLLLCDVARATNCHRNTIIRLEKRGLIKSWRDVNGWRRFSPDVPDKIRSLYANGEYATGQKEEESEATYCGTGKGNRDE